MANGKGLVDKLCIHLGTRLLINQFSMPPLPFRIMSSFTFQIAFTEPHEVPLMSDLSVSLSPGTQASISVENYEVMF